jgi:hypothetical protein
MGVNDSHPRYDLCRDCRCDRYGCVAYREGRDDGYDDGHDDGRKEGYDDGFSEGLAACQATHSRGE